MNLKTRLRSFWQITLDLFIDYCNHSSIHGVSYVVEKGRLWFERIWWIAALCVSILYCGKLVFDAWNIDPIIISFTEKPTPVWQIPFPAVTICPTLFAQSKHINITSMLQYLKDDTTSYAFTENDVMKLIALSKFCPSKLLQHSLQRYIHCNGCLDKLREIRIPPDQLFAECKFHDHLINCSASFKELVLNYALCYTFNGLDIFRENVDNPSAREWSIDEAYKPNAALDVYPRRVLGAGSLFGLSVLLRINKSDIDYACYKDPGFWVEYRMPSDVPQFMTNFFNIRLKNSMTFVLKPQMIVTSDDLRTYPTIHRKCYFSNERRLKYFEQYTQSNCEIECGTEYILSKCGCLQILKENVPGDVDICGPYQLNCINYYNGKLHRQNFKSCGCLPACSSLTYESEVAVTTMNMSNHADYQKDFEYSRLIFYFKESQFMQSQRTKLYGRTDFLANCGGLLGLCLGVSVMSVIEIFYFCTLRLFCQLGGRDRSIDRSQVIFDGELHYFRIRSSRFLKMTRNLIIEYSTKTTIQGIKYVVDSSLSMMERLWWLIVVMFSVIFCGSLIFNVFKRFDQFPLIISYENEETSATQIPFPAISICPQVVSLDIAFVFQFFHVENMSLYDLEPNDIDAVTALAQVCDAEVLGAVDPKNRTNCDKCSQILHSMMDNADAMLTHCSHLHSNELCSELFKPVMTETGLCFKFNGLAVHRTNDSEIPEEWTLEGGYRNSSGHADIYPRNGSKFPLVINLEVDNAMNDGWCKGPIQGFKIFLHLPNEAPQISKHYVLVPYKQTVEITIVPKMITTAAELRDIAVTQRQCYFNDERYLRFFNYYTQNNCAIECLANMTVSKCGCLRFHMPKIPGIKFCGISDIKCYQRAIHESVKQNINHSELSDCNCLPSCTSISYDTEINQISMDDAAIDSYYWDPQFVNNFSLAEVVVGFKETQFVALKRTRLYGKTDLLAKCGGLLSLFLGFSLMSVLELVYFCTIRLCCNIRTQLIIIRS